MPVSEKRQKILIVVLIIILIAIAAILYYVFFGGGTLPAPVITPSGLLPAPLQPQPTVSIEKQIESIKLDSSILDSSLFKSLKIYGEIPIKIESFGRDNPFSPF